MHLALTQIFLKSGVFSFFFFVSWKSWHMHRIRENLKHDKLYLARAVVCSRSHLLVGCFENVLSLEKKYCSDLCLLPLLLQQPNFMLIQTAALWFGGWCFPQLWQGQHEHMGCPQQGSPFQPCLPGSSSPFLAILFIPIKDILSPANSARLKAAFSQSLGYTRSP